MHLKSLDSIILQGRTPTKVQYYNHKKETTLATPSIGNTLRAFTLLHSTGEHMMTSIICIYTKSDYNVTSMYKYNIFGIV